MAKTINRQIRRIGLLPTTFKEVHDGERKLKTADGEVVEKIIKKVPIRHSKALAEEERAAAAETLRKQDRERHLKFRAERKAANKKVSKKAA